MSIWTRSFWKATAERAIKTFAQTGAAILTAGGAGILDTDWQTAASVSGMAAAISLLTSIGSDFLPGVGPSAFGPESIDGGDH